MDGRVKIEGCAVYLPLYLEEISFRAFKHHEFDVSELSGRRVSMMPRLLGRCALKTTVTSFPPDVVAPFSVSRAWASRIGIRASFCVVEIAGRTAPAPV
jgi:hypothetical protein